MLTVKQLPAKAYVSSNTVTSVWPWKDGKTSFLRAVMEPGGNGSHPGALPNSAPSSQQVQAPCLLASRGSLLNQSRSCMMLSRLGQGRQRSSAARGADSGAAHTLTWASRKTANADRPDWASRCCTTFTDHSLLAASSGRGNSGAAAAAASADMSTGQQQQQLSLQQQVAFFQHQQEVAMAYHHH